MRNKLNFLKSFSTYTIVAVLPMMIGLILAPITTRHLSTTDVGIINYFTNLTSFLTIIFSFGFDSGFNILFFNSKYEIKDKEKLTANVIVLQLILCLVLCAFCFLLADFIHSFFVKSEAEFPKNPYFYYTILASVISFPMSILLIYYRNEKKVLGFFILNVVNFLLIAGTNVYLIVWLDKGAFEVVTSRIIISSVFFIVVILILRKNIFRFPDTAVLKNIFLTSWSMYIYVIILFLSTFIDKYFVERYFDFAHLGIYGLSYVIGGQIPQVVMQVLGNLMSPFILRQLGGEDPDMKHVFLALKFNFFMMVIMVYFIILIAPGFIHFFLGKDFYSCADFVPFIAYSYIFRMSFSNYQIFLYAHNKTFTFTIAAIISLIISVVFMIFTIPYFGVYAIAFSLIINRICNIPLVKYFAKKEFDLSKSSFGELNLISWLGFVVLIFAYYYPDLSVYLYSSAFLLILIYIFIDGKKNYLSYKHLLKNI